MKDRFENSKDQERMRRFDLESYRRPQLTRSELRQQFVDAWANTARLPTQDRARQATATHDAVRVGLDGKTRKAAAKRAAP